VLLDELDRAARDRRRPVGEDALERVGDGAGRQWRSTRASLMPSV
jgi:hypothetical protein